MVADGAINGELFLAYVEQEWVKTLKEGDIVVMDNLSSHKVAGVKEVIESVGEEFFIFLLIVLICIRSNRSSLN